MVLDFHVKSEETFFFFLMVFLLQVPAICLILTKSLDRHQKFQREAAAAALSEFVRYRYVLTDLPQARFSAFLSVLFSELPSD